MAQKQKWQERLFGRQLVACNTITKSNEFDCLQTLEVLNDHTDVIGVYFSFANVNSQNDDFIKKLKELYVRINNGGVGGVVVVGDSNTNKRLEVIQVILWANNDVYGDDFETSHMDSLINMPWYGIPYCEIDLKTKLSRRYRIKSGVPTLVLLDNKDGTTISASAQDRLLEDPNGITFPWRPRPVDQVLKDVVLQPGGSFYKEHINTKGDIFYSELPEGIKGFYFSANWCPPCRAFTPQLIDVYKRIRKRETNFEIIFVSSDRSPESYSAYVDNMPWLAIPWQQTAIRSELAELYAIRGIPTLLLLDSNGHVITMDARAELAEDPIAQNFPWKPRAVNILTERFASKLHDYPAIVLFVDGEDTEIQFAESVLQACADLYYEKYNININSQLEEIFNNIDVVNDDDDYDERYIQFLIGIDTDTTSDLLRDLIGLDDEVVPLLIAVDLPKHRYVTMEYGLEINVESVLEFIEKFRSGALKYCDINDAARLAATMNEFTENG